MKVSFNLSCGMGFLWRTWAGRLGFALGWGWLWALPVGAATLNVSPAAAPATYAGMVMVTAGGLQPGETVVLRRWLDLDGDGGVNPGQDLLMLEVRIPDNQVPILAGVTNWNVPFDQDPAPGALRVWFNYYKPYLDHAVGTHLWELVSPTGLFGTVRQVQTFTNPPLGQGVRGVVRGSGTNLPAAVVVAIDLVRDGSFAAAVVTDRQGRYELRLPPGFYAVIAAKPGWVTDVDAPFMVGLTEPGQMVLADLELIPATHTLSGRLVNAANVAQGLPAIFLQAESDTGLFAPGWTDSDGRFTIGVSGGQWRIEPAEEDLALHGCLYPDMDQGFLTTTGSVSGIRLEAVPANAAFYGRVTDVGGQPMAGVRLRVHGQAGSSYYQGHDPVTDESGRYTAMAVGGSPSWWQLTTDPHINPLLTNHVVSGFRFNQSVSAGQALRQDVRALIATNQITGVVRDAHGRSVEGLGVLGWTSLNGETFYGSGLMTDPAGRYRMPVSGSDWQVQVYCHDLLDAGFNCVPALSVTVPPGGARADFVVYPLPAPGLSVPVRMGPDQFFVPVHGEPFVSYEVQVSSDLRQWQPLRSITPRMDGPFYTNAVVVDSAAGRSPRFYRLLRR